MNGAISIDRKRLERQITGGLKSAIDAHGPIVYTNIGSAMKRIAAQVIADLKEQGILTSCGELARVVAVAEE